MKMSLKSSTNLEQSKDKDKEKKVEKDSILMRREESLNNIIELQEEYADSPQNTIKQNMVKLNNS